MLLTFLAPPKDQSLVAGQCVILHDIFCQTGRRLLGACVEFCLVAMHALRRAASSCQAASTSPRCLMHASPQIARLSRRYNTHRREKRASHFQRAAAADSDLARLPREALVTALRRRDPVFDKWFSRGLTPPFGGPPLSLAAQVLPLDQGRSPIVLVFPADVDAVLETYIASGRESLDPYWSRPWPSAVALAEVLLQRPALSSGRAVCDLGAGLGVGGLAAALAGASRVVLLDREPLALQCALLSARASGLDAADPEDVAQDTGTALALGRQVSAAVLDWSVAYRGPPFELCIACDVLYETFSVDPVARLVPQLLGGRDGSQLVLADPPTRTPANRARFVDLVGVGGLVLEEARTAATALDAMAAADAEGGLFEMVGSATSSSEVQMMIFRSNAFGSTLGLKAR